MRAQRKFTTIAVPAPLKAFTAFLTWNREDGRKVPYYANGSKRHGVQGSEQDRAQLVSFEDAVAAAEKYGHTGIGIALLPGMNLVAGDFDNCVKDGQIDPQVEQLVLSTYAEYSPSGNGIRAFWWGDLGDHKDPHPKDGGFGFETFSSKGFVTLTGHALEHVDMLGGLDYIDTASPAVKQLCAARFGQIAPRPASNDNFLELYEPQDILTPEMIRQGLSVMDPNATRDVWVRVGMALHYDQSGSEEAFELWHEWSAQADEVNERGAARYQGETDCRKTWESFGRHRDRKQISGKTFIKLANSAGAELAPPVQQSAQVEGSEQTEEGFTPLSTPDTTLEKPKSPNDWEYPPPITQFEADCAQLTPRCIIKDYLYADLALLVAPGGVGKTTLMLYEAIHIVLGLPFFGHEVVTPGPVLIITAEDDRPLMVARLKRVAQDLHLTEEQMAQVYARVHISDLTGEMSKLVRVESNGQLRPSLLVKAIINRALAQGEDKPVLINIDPAISFGVGESMVNDGEQALVEVARRFKRAIGCAVRFLVHTGKQNARLGTLDQYSSRGGSAFADGSRMVQVMANLTEKDWRTLTGTDLGEKQSGIVLARPKLSYCAPQPLLYILRTEFKYELIEATQSQDAEEKEARQKDSLSALSQRVWDWLAERASANPPVLHSKTVAIDLIWGELNIPRNRLRAVFDDLIHTGRVDASYLPPGEQKEKGGKRGPRLVVFPNGMDQWSGPSTDE